MGDHPLKEEILEVLGFPDNKKISKLYLLIPPHMLAQDNFYKLCMRSFKNKEANDYDTCVEISQWLVVEFFEDRAIRPFG